MNLKSIINEKINGIRYLIARAILPDGYHVAKSPPKTGKGSRPRKYPTTEQ